jgi:hypothetical protein
VQPPRNLQILAHRELGIGRRCLNEMPDPPPWAAPAGPNRLAEQRHTTCAWADHAEQRPDGSRFASAIKAKEAVYFSTVNP